MLARPITSLSIVGCKLITAALVTAAIWVLMLAFTSLLLLRPGFYQALVEAASREPFWKTLAALTAVMALLIALTWKNMVSNLWVALTGRAWVSHVHGVGLGAAILAGGVLGLWIYFHPAWHSAALASVPWAIALAALAKLAAAALALAGLVHARLASVNGAAILVAAWCALVAACFAFAMWLVPERYFDIAQVFPAIVLLVPFVRLASAPLALDWNRHR